jgi:exosome complex RNA-binding protein Rrp4
MDEDRLQMRDYFREGDLISCEIQKVTESGEAVLHMRSNKYCALQNGQLVRVDASLVKRQASHVFNILSDSVYLVIGNNGWIWIGAPAFKSGHIQSINFTQVSNVYRCVPEETRLRIVRVRQAVLGLAHSLIEVNGDSINAVVEESLNEDSVTSTHIERARSKLLSQN